MVTLRNAWWEGRKKKALRRVKVLEPELIKKRKGMNELFLRCVLSGPDCSNWILRCLLVIWQEDLGGTLLSLVEVCMSEGVVVLEGEGLFGFPSKSLERDVWISALTLYLTAMLISSAAVQWMWESSVCNKDRKCAGNEILCEYRMSTSQISSVQVASLRACIVQSY